MGCYVLSYGEGQISKLKFLFVFSNNSPVFRQFNSFSTHYNNSACACVQVNKIALVYILNTPLFNYQDHYMFDCNIRSSPDQNQGQNCSSVIMHVRALQSSFVGDLYIPVLRPLGIHI